MNYKTKQIIDFYATPKRLRTKRAKDLARELDLHPNSVRRLRNNLSAEIETEINRRAKEEIAKEVLLSKSQEGDVQAVRTYKAVTGRMDGEAEKEREKQDNSYSMRLIRNLADANERKYRAAQRELEERTVASTVETEAGLNAKEEVVSEIEGGVEKKEGGEAASGEVTDPKEENKTTVVEKNKSRLAEPKVTKPKPTKPGVNKRKILNPLPAYRCELLEEMLAEDRRIEKEMKEGIRSDVGTIRNI